jgi:type I restriction enzyme S subunit
MSESGTVPLSTLARLLSGGTPSKAVPEYWSGNIPWLTPKDMGKWNGTTEESVSQSALGNGTRLAPACAIFVAVRGMSLHNEIRVIHSDRELAFNQDIKAIVPREGVNARFLYYALLAKKPDLLDNVESAGHGTGRLPTDRLESLEIANLSQDSQKDIAEILSWIDDKIDLNRRMNETLEAMARAIFKDWFVDFGPTRAKAEGRPSYLAPDIWTLFPDRLDNEMKPEGWKVEPLDRIASFLNGLALQKYPAKESRYLPVIKIAELRSASVVNSDKASLDIPENYIVEDGDILFSWSGSLLHRVWTSGRGALNQHLFKVTSDTFPKWFYFHWIGHHMEDFRATAASKATTMGHIQRHHLAQAMTIVPTGQMLKAADGVIAPLFERCIANDLEARTLAQTRDLLLPKLMSGEIRVREAERALETAA